ncbi:MAG: hypothetical protein ACXIUP_08195 [Microcella sp.]
MITLADYADDRGMIRVATLNDAAIRARAAAGARRGELIRLARGCYLPTPIWNTLDQDARYRARIRAAVAGRLAPDELLCGMSAAALWRLSLPGEWPADVHTVRPRNGGGRRSGIVTRHSTSVADAGAWVEGLPVTTVERTVADLAGAHSRYVGVAVADAALAGLDADDEHPFSRDPVSRDALRAEAERLPRSAGRTRALAAVAFADARAANAGESGLRVTLDRLGVPAPELQASFVSASGRQYFVDFWWPEQRFILEFDGKRKYFDARYRGGRTAAQVVYDEKEREDELRAEVNGFARADWDVAGSPERLAARLRRAGFVFP